MKTKTNILFYFFLLTFAFILCPLSFILVSCNTTEPPPQISNLTIVEFDKAVTEIYLHLHNNKPNQDNEMILIRDGQIISRFFTSAVDTFLVDTNLTSSTFYKYLVREINQNETVTSSNEISVRTLEPSNRSFRWESYEFGDHNYSSIWDISIIDENNIWAVGEIYLKDSVGQNDRKPYAAANWDGEKWNLDKVPYQDYGNPRPPAYAGPLFAVDALDEKTIYSASFANLLKFENNSWNEKAFFMTDLTFMGQLKRISILNESQIYCVGNSGTIYLVMGNEWRLVVSGTKNDIYDICGYVNPLTNKEEMICGSSDRENPSNNLLIRISDTDNLELIKHPENVLIGSAWTNKGFPIFTCGAGIYTNKTGEWKEITLEVNYGSSKIRGNGLNDIFVCGVNGFAVHYNGVDWKILDGFENIIFTSICVKENIIVMAGYKNNKALITIGRR